MTTLKRYELQEPTLMVPEGGRYDTPHCAVNGAWVVFADDATSEIERLEYEINYRDTKLHFLTVNRDNWQAQATNAFSTITQLNLRIQELEQEFSTNIWETSSRKRIKELEQERDRLQARVMKYEQQLTITADGFVMSDDGVQAYDRLRRLIGALPNKDAVTYTVSPCNEDDMFSITMATERTRCGTIAECESRKLADALAALLRERQVMP